MEVKKSDETREFNPKKSRGDRKELRKNYEKNERIGV